MVFRSDNMSTVSVLREVLSKETALKKVAVKITHGQSPHWFMCHLAAESN